MGKIQGETIYTTLHVCFNPFPRLLFIKRMRTFHILIMPPSSDAAIASPSLTNRWDLLQSPSGFFSLYSFRSADPHLV